MPNRPDRQHFRLHFEGEAQPVLFDPLVLPPSARDWGTVFDILAQCEPEIIGAHSAIETCTMALSGVLTSLSRSTWVPLPDNGCITVTYNYQTGRSARLHLRGYGSFGRVQSMGSFNLHIDDPEWMFLRYLAQREARASLGLCQTCGKEMKSLDHWLDRWLGRQRNHWHHPHCREHQWNSSEKRF
jgi:hypothetical protein